MLPDFRRQHFVLHRPDDAERAVQVAVDHLPPALKVEFGVRGRIADRPAVSQVINRAPVRRACGGPVRRSAPGMPRRTAHKSLCGRVLETPRRLPQPGPIREP